VLIKDRRKAAAWSAAASAKREDASETGKGVKRGDWEPDVAQSDRKGAAGVHRVFGARGGRAKPAPFEKNNKKCPPQKFDNLQKYVKPQK